MYKFTTTMLIKKMHTNKRDKIKTRNHWKKNEHLQYGKNKIKNVGSFGLFF